MKGKKDIKEIKNNVNRINDYLESHNQNHVCISVKDGCHCWESNLPVLVLVNVVSCVITLAGLFFIHHYLSL